MAPHDLATSPPATASAAPASPAGTRFSVELLAAVTASIVGTLIPAAFGGGSTSRLLGMLAGAALPTLITHIGPYQPLRIVLGLLAAAAAIGVTYFGASAVNASTFPVPEPLEQVIGTSTPEPIPPGDPTPTPAPTATATPTEDPDSRTYRANGVGMVVTPRTVVCREDGTCPDVTVKSIGDRELELTDIGFEGQGRDDFRVTGDCANKTLVTPSTCAIGVTFDPQEADGRERTATLVIHQNVGAHVAKVESTAVAPLRNDVGLGELSCTPRADGSLEVGFDLDASGDRVGTVEVVASGGSGSGASNQFAAPGDDLALTLTGVAAGDSIRVTVGGGTGPDDLPENDVRKATAPVDAPLDQPGPCGPPTA